MLLFAPRTRARRALTLLPILVLPAGADAQTNGQTTTTGESGFTTTNCAVDSDSIYRCDWTGSSS